uniref:Uncharacterized protein n=1 Tax=Romanomermis culicivorax TaxID=13658 RepID=A0A915I0M8_ROMCU
MIKFSTLMKKANPQKCKIFDFDNKNHLLQKDDDDVEKRDYIFYLAMAYTRIKEYDKALNAVEAGLRVEPTNNQFLTLKQLIISRRKLWE